jgi:hypothetical protein
MVSIAYFARMIFILFAFLWTVSVHAADKNKHMNRRPSSTPVFASEHLKLRAIASGLVPKSFTVAKQKKSFSPRVRTQTEEVVQPQSMRKNFMYN